MSSACEKKHKSLIEDPPLPDYYEPNPNQTPEPEPIKKTEPDSQQVT